MKIKTRMKGLLKMRNKLLAAVLAGLCLLVSGCGKYVINEDADIENNATASVTAEGVLYELKDDSIYADGKLLAENIGASEDFIVVLGNKVYFNTEEGTKYALTKNGKVKKFGNGRIIYARGLWLYYQNISLFAVNAQDGEYIMLKDPAPEFKEDTGSTLIFTDGEKDYSIEYNGRAFTEE